METEIRRPEPLAPAAEAEGRELFAHPGMDVPTLALLLAMWAGLAGNFAWYVSAPAPAVVHVLVSILFLNLSFTVWHEGAHGTVFRARWANDVVGVLGTFPLMIPYFMIRRVHHLHHEFTNDPARDPDHWFTESPFWKLPLRYPRGARQARAKYLASAPPAWELWANRGSSVLGLAVLALLAWRLGFLPLVWVWLVPRLAILWIHAWYVNYMPHRALPAERYRDTRIFPLGWLTAPMLCHNYHGLHHAWQTVPWHRYARAFRAKEGFLCSRGTPIRRKLFEL